MNERDPHRAAAPTLLLSTLLLPFGVASLVILCVVTSSSEGSLPTFGWAAAFLFGVVEEDVRRMRIPNWLTLPALGLALVYAGVAAGLDGVLFGLAGAGTAFALLFLPFAARWMGAGDVKAIMVLGALWGASVVLGLVWWSILVGGVLGLCWLVVRGELHETIARWFRSAHLAATTHTFTYFPPDPGSAATARLPFGVAIGLGVAAYQLWGTPWA